MKSFFSTVTRPKVFVSGSFIPAIPEVAEELGTDVSVVRYAYLASFCQLSLKKGKSWAVSIMWFVGSFASMTWATYATFCESATNKLGGKIFTMGSPDGRRVAYIYSMPCLAVGSFGVSVSRSVPELLFWRSIQAVGSSAGMSTGMAIIGDIYKLEERGTAMGITFGVGLLYTCAERNG